ncbi:MAG: ThiF family adenylyltransferase [Planctomycetota bacterium]
MSDSGRVRPRHARQARFQQIGDEGQRNIAKSTAAIVGLGALGSVSAETLARAGVGTLIFIDRDVVEETNLQRQVLYTESDVAEALPKAEAARRAIVKIDSTLKIHAAVEDLSPANIDRLLSNADVIVDGTDNFATRYLMNDFAVANDKPWIYGAAVSSSGFVMTVQPNKSACLCCVFPEPPPPEETPTCETAGIVASASGMVALAQSMEALKILSGRADHTISGLQHFDPWMGMYRILQCERDPNCSCCVRGDRAWLRGERSNATVTLCGRNSVQVGAAQPVKLDLAAIAKKVPNVISINSFSLRFSAEEHTIILFPDGRAIISDTADPAAARTLYSRYIGN